MEPEVLTRQQFWGDYASKDAEVSNTHLMPAESSTGEKKVSKTVIPKVGSALESYLKVAEEVPPDDNIESPVPGEQPPQNPQAAPINPRVDVSAKEPPKIIKEKEAQHYALPSMQRYPLDSYADVKTAAVYFEQWEGQFSPKLRHEFCQNLVKRASALGIEVGTGIQKLGSSTYAPDAELEIAIAGRRSILQNADHVDLLDKLATARPLTEPETFALALEEFDKLAGIDFHYGSDILDPYTSTFGVKTAADNTASTEDDGSWSEGNDYVTWKDLKGLASSYCSDLESHFGPDFVEEFRKDPIGIFKSLPVDQKKIISRQANDKYHPQG